MAGDSSNFIEYIVFTTKEYSESLSQIRHFYNLKVAFDKDTIWIKGFSLDQLESIEVNTLPFKSIFYVENNLLFPKGSVLPKRKLPSMLLWSPIAKAFRVETPKMNHNFFGIHDAISPKIVPSKEEKETVAILTSIHSNTKKTLESTAAYRFKNIKYTLINSDTLLIIGTPLLPVQGESYWQQDDFLYPNGYSLEYPILSSSIKKILNPLGAYYILWEKDSSYLLIPKSDCLILSISSLRLSLATLAL